MTTFHNPHFNPAPPTANVQIPIQPIAGVQPVVRVPWRPLETVTCFKVIVLFFIYVVFTQNKWWITNISVYFQFYLCFSVVKKVIMQIR